jgi:hypothetical protein
MWIICNQNALLNNYEERGEKRNAAWHNLSMLQDKKLLGEPNSPSKIMEQANKFLYIVKFVKVILWLIQY